MPCDTKARTPTERELQQAALERLRAKLAAGSASVVIGAQGGIAFAGWQDRGGVSDLCAYRKLLASNSPELRRAVMAAEARYGRKIDPKAIAAGMHSHDGGHTWGAHLLAAGLALLAPDAWAHSGHGAALTHSHVDLLTLSAVGVLVATLAALRR